VDNIVEILKALSDQSRYTMVTLLLRRDFCVGALAKRMGTSEAAVSQHLQILRKAGIVRGEKRGYFTHYQVDRELLKAVSNEFIDMASQVSESGCGCQRDKPQSECCGCRKEGMVND
jgi:ArsR family transcriptional regulator